jgi:aspartyl protease family protein
VIVMRLSALICLSLCCFAAVAAPQIQVVGLFPGAAVLNVDGQRKLVRVGQTGPEGVQVVSADSHKAVLRVGGVEQTYELSREYSGAGYAAPAARTEMGIARGTGGHYWVAGTINNQNAQFLVDTGATSVAMNEGQARRLGIDYRASGTPMMASTASGTAKGWRVTLNSVKLGGVEVLGVEAVVLEGEFPTEILLGMSYLNRVGWREDQGMMYIQSKH